ncbi:hypothetical protein Pla110_40410 [Polystyrenella longa]|uniref:DUF922 domain-containing protein n=1 Tax=Polystyrenella longa TaxID=2528007 RepID=A0A518CSU3_9PLAN|nr:DUF922 domain-containing protein [Polystyrenella longa]QDU82286.1 hypothetical protein Pla110_40410 [Polystyrenella longa]
MNNVPYKLTTSHLIWLACLIFLCEIVIAGPDEIKSQALESWNHKRDEVRYQNAMRKEYIDVSSLFYAQMGSSIPGYNRLEELTGSIPIATERKADPLVEIPEGTQEGDVLFIEGKQPMALVYIGMDSFPDATLKYPFFIYPYQNGLEKNTFPPRYHKALLSEDELEKYKDQFKEIADSERKVTWLAVRQRDGFQPTFSRDNFRGSKFTVYRHTGEVSTPAGEDSVDRSPLKREDIPLYDPQIKFRFEPVKIYHYSLEATSLEAVYEVLNTDSERIPLMKKKIAEVQKNYTKPDGGTFDLQNNVSYEDGLFVGFSPESSAIQLSTETRDSSQAHMKKATFTMQAFILLPQWEGGSAAEKAAWQQTYEKLLDHEIGHAKIWRTNWTAWAKNLEGKTYEEVVELIKKTSQQEQKEQVEFDEKTNHGLK